MVSLLNGFSQMGSAVAGFAHDAGLTEQKAQLERQQAELVSSLNEGVQTRLAHVQGEESRDTAQVSAEAHGSQQRQTQAAANELPVTAAQQADIDYRNRTATETERHNKAEEDKPLAGGFTGSFLVRNKETGEWEPRSSSTSTAPIEIDPTSNNLSAQTGLSDNAIKVMTGQTKGLRLNAQQSKDIGNEITKWGVAKGINTSTLQPQVAAQAKIIEQNVSRNNQATILEGELQASIDNSKQIVDDLKQGRVKMANVVKVWGGEQTNDPTTLKAVDQLSRLRNEVASYNAVAGGHLMENGTPAPTPADFKEAEHLISNGINSGGLTALQESIHLSAAKNRNILEKAIDDANKDFYKLFGATYHVPNRATESPAAPDAATSPASATPAASTSAPAATTKPTPDPKVQQQITDASIKSTAEKRGITEDQVKKELRDLGYTVP